LVAAAIVWHGAPALAQQQAGPAASSKDKDKAKSDTITVTGQRAKVVRTIQGTTYDERSNPEGQAGSALDILNTVPSVSVSPEGAITVRGNGDVKLYIDGRPAPSSDPDTIQAIPGSAIASVDLITNPSAKYDADGSIVVNLTLKKGAKDGFHSSETVNLGDRGRGNVALDSSLGAGKLAATLNLSVRDAVRLTRNRTDTILFDAGGAPQQAFATEAIYTPIHAKSANIVSSLDYALTPDSDLGIDATYTHAYPIDIVREDHRDRNDAQDLLSVYQRVRGGSYYSNTHGLSAHYQRRGHGKAASVKVTLQDSRHSVISDRIFTTTYASSDSSGVERVLNEWITGTRLASLDIGKAVGGGVTLSGGGEWRRDTTRQVNDRAAINPAGGPVGASDFRARQRTAALYATAEARSDGWTIEAGGRYEQIRLDSALENPSRPFVLSPRVSAQPSPRTGFVEAHHATGPSTSLRANGSGLAVGVPIPQSDRQRHYAAFNESVSVARQLGRGQVLVKASHAKQKISADDLDPAMVYIEAQTRAVGNPDLKPQTVSSAEIEYDYSHRSIDSSISLYYRRVDDTIDDFIVFEPDNVAIRTRRNGGPSRSFGATLTLSDTLFKTLAYSATVNVFHSELSVLGQALRPSEAMLSYTLQGSLDWTLSRADRLHLDADVDGPTLVPQGTRTGTSALNAVYTRTLSPRLSLTLTAHGLLQQMHILTDVESGRAVSITDGFTSRRAFLAGFRYKLL